MWVISKQHLLSMSHSEATIAGSAFFAATANATATAPPPPPPPEVVASPALKARIAKYADKDAISRAKELKRLANRLLKILRARGEEAFNNMSTPEELASLETTVVSALLPNDTEVSKEDRRFEEQLQTVSKPKRKKTETVTSVTKEEAFARFRDKILFVVDYYKEAVFDHIATVSESDLEAVFRDDNDDPAPLEEFKLMDNRISEVQSVALNVVLVAEYLRGKLIREAIRQHATFGGVVDTEERDQILRSTFNLSPDYGMKVVNLHNLFSYYPRLMLVSVNPRSFHVFKPQLDEFLMKNPDVAEALQVSLGDVKFSASVKLNNFEGSDKVVYHSTDPSVIDLEVPEFPNYQSAKLAGVKRNPRQQQPPQPQPQQNEDEEDEEDIDIDLSPSTELSDRLQEVSV